MTYNVPVVYDVARPPLRQCASIAGAGNVGVRKHHKGRKPEWCFSHPSRLQAAYIYNPVMCSLAWYHFLYQ